MWETARDTDTALALRSVTSVLCNERGREACGHGNVPLLNAYHGGAASSAANVAAVTMSLRFSAENWVNSEVHFKRISESYALNIQLFHERLH